MAEALDELTGRGFTESFGVVGGRLRVLGTGVVLTPQDLVIREYRRFEGVSDPDDMAIVYAIEAPGGIRGTLTDAFGVYSDPAVSAALADVPIRATA
ncbi:MAG TPA: phosphoribosylpyrophosphate synthetase [Methylomirabilota bacterium]|nr:phosphoribosylpyrophosphate synthetase [Methylomirabilota bacterium]